MQTLLDQDQFITVVDRIGIYYFHHDILFMTDDVENTLENILTAYQYGGMGREEANGWLAEENLPVTITIDNGLYVAGYDHHFEFTGTVLTNYDGAAYDLGQMLVRVTDTVSAKSILTRTADTSLYEKMMSAVLSIYGKETGHIMLGGELLSTEAVMEAIAVNALQAEEAKLTYKSQLRMPNQRISLRGYRAIVAKAERVALDQLKVEQNSDGFAIVTPFNGLSVTTPFKYRKAGTLTAWPFLEHFPTDVLDAWLDETMDLTVLVEDNQIAWPEFLERATEQLATPAFGDYVSFNIGKFHVKSMRKATFQLVLRDLLTERLKLWNL